MQETMPTYRQTAANTFSSMINITANLNKQPN